MRIKVISQTLALINGFGTGNGIVNGDTMQIVICGISAIGFLSIQATITRKELEED